MTRISHVEAAYTDTYLTDVLFEAFNDHPPIRATRITVETDHVSEPGAPREVRVRVSVSGERLQRRDDGWATTGPVVRAYGLGEEPVRYGLCREAVLEALARHDLTAEEVVGFAFLQPWEEHAATLDTGSSDLSGMRNQVEGRD
ncbi:hypothetical protein ACI3ET_12860 [Ornithinimicrobium sp. LYQ121]|uniref:hypothetical protein n=1 Tax=Ornithinimicrobium sp. LYQ121 TaxID=3378801 RepID=UPI003851A516